MDNDKPDSRRSSGAASAASSASACARSASCWCSSGWNGAASVDRIPSQFPYLISGGVAGLCFVVLGVGMLVVQNQRADRAALQATLRELQEALERAGLAEGTGEKREPSPSRAPVRRASPPGQPDVDDTREVAIDLEPTDGPDSGRRQPLKAARAGKARKTGRRTTAKRTPSARQRADAGRPIRLVATAVGDPGPPARARPGRRSPPPRRPRR